jgi:flagellar FliL protein
MADEDEDKNPQNGDTPEGEEGAKKKGPLAFLDKLPPKLKLPIMIGAPVLLILLIVLGLFLGGVFGGEKPKEDAAQADGAIHEDEAEHAADAEGHVPVYYDMPNMIVNLDGRGRKKSLLKMAVTLELGSEEDLKVIETRLPRVTDEFQVFLREIRIEDLRGSAGIYRLRQELLARIKPAVAPVKVRDVLFKELLIQ